MKIVKQSSTQLIVRQVPIQEWIICSILIVMTTCAMLTHPTADPQVNLLWFISWMLALCIALIMFYSESIIRVVTWNFDKIKGTLAVNTLGVFGNKTSEYSLQNIKQILVDRHFEGITRIEIVLITKERLYLLVNDKLATEEASYISNFLSKDRF